MPDGNVPNTSLTPAGIPALADYRQQGGFRAVESVSGQSDAGDRILNEVRTARLRGRGGAGMPVADKWQAVRRGVQQRGGPPMLVCNAYDADPHSLVAQTLLSSQPFVVVEGLILAALAVGAREATIYIRSGNRAGYDAMTHALNQARDAGLLRNLAVTLAGVEVGFMGGEESTMLQVLRGMRAMAVQRPPFPAQVGLHDRPTAVNNVETIAQVAAVMRNGAAAYLKTGTAETPGTKMITVVDPQGKSRLVEASFGLPVAEIVTRAGVPLTPDTARAVVVGGPEGGALPPDLWKTPFDFAPLAQVGAIVGSGTVRVLAKDTCMVAWAMDQTDFLAKESCGKCIPCRTGTKRINGTLQGIVSDVGNVGDLDLLAEFADYVPDGSLCGFGWNATNGLKTAMRYFADDFQHHLAGTCPTGACAVPVRSHRFATKGVL
jgi:NADH:ubiquinone oxidoreductase subunit F (NADH-binding)